MEPTKFIVKPGGKIYTAEFRLAFGHLFVPTQYQNKGAYRYSMNMLFPKAGGIKALEQALKSAEEKFEKWEGEMPAGGRNPVQDGDNTVDKNGKQVKNNQNMWVVSAATPADLDDGTRVKLKLINAQKIAVEDAAEFYDGCWCRALIRAQAYQMSNNNFGLKFKILGVQKWRDDEPFGGGATDDDFDYMDGGVGNDDDVPF